MKRNATQSIVKWNSSKHRKPLIVWGARQVGKTYLVKDIFGETYYHNRYIYIDFKKEDQLREFCSKTADAQRIIEQISLLKGRRIDQDTLLIFDEIQECPNVISSLKYFCQDYPQIPVIATGSMVRIKIQRITHRRGSQSSQGFLFPVGKVTQITIYPMTFDEFLMNANEVLYEKISAAYARKVALDGDVHELALDYVYRYLLVGGMPEAVGTFLETNDLLETISVLKDLYDNYLSDMELYQTSQESALRSRTLFSNIYKELSRESKNFSPGLIEKGSKTRDFNSPIQWLTMAQVVHQSFQLKEHVTMPLMSNEDSTFRLYLGDIGMFSYQSGINAASFISSNRENTLSGIFFENFVANELSAAGLRLFYWKGKADSEIEFIVESDNKLYPIDVKKGRGVLNSLEKFSSHNKFELAIKISRNNFGIDGKQKLVTVPFYFVPFLSKEMANGTFDLGKTNATEPAFQ